MYPISIYSVNHTILGKQLSKSFFNITIKLNSTFSSSSSSSSSSSLQTLTSSETKSISNPLYHFLPQTQNPNNIVNLICSSLKHNNSHLTHLQNDIKDLLPHLGTQEISRVLLRCQSDSSAALTFFNWVKNELGLRPTSQNYCTVVHILASSKNFSPAMKLLCELIQIVKDVTPNEDLFEILISCTDDCNWDPVVFDMLIKGYVKLDMIPEGLRTFKKMVKVGFVPNVIAVNCLLNGLSKFDCFDRCWEVYEVMGRIGIYPNSYTFNILTHAFCKNGYVDKVNQFLEKMEEEGFDPDIVTYNTLINSYCRKGRLEDAFYLYRIMYRRQVMPDLVSYTSLMNGLVKYGRVREAHQTFHRMVHRGLIPDVVSYNTLIYGYCKEGKLQDSRSLLHDMVSDGLCPDSFTCRTLVMEGYGKEGKLISALNLVVELERFGVSVPWDVYDYLIVTLCHENKPFAAKSLLGRVSQDGIGYKPNMEICKEMILSFCKCDFVAEALALKAEIMMVHRNAKPNLDMYRALISCLCRLNRAMEGEHLMREMIESSLSPDSAVCRDLVNGYCKQRDFDEAGSLLNFFAMEFQLYDIESYNALVRVLCEEGDVAKSMEVQDKMLKVGYTPNSLTCKYMVRGLRKSMEVGKHRLLEE